MSYCLPCLLFNFFLLLLFHVVQHHQRYAATFARTCVTSAPGCVTCARGGSSLCLCQRCDSSSCEPSCERSCCLNVVSSWSTRKQKSTLITFKHWQDLYNKIRRQGSGFYCHSLIFFFSHCFASMQRRTFGLNDRGSPLHTSLF